MAHIKGVFTSDNDGKFSFEFPNMPGHSGVALIELTQVLRGEWKPPAIENRPDGFECLAFHRGKWRHVKWLADHGWWSLGFSKPHITDADRLWSPLPETPADLDHFFSWTDNAKISDRARDDDQ